MSFESQNAPTEYARLAVADYAAPSHTYDFARRKIQLEVFGLEFFISRTV